MTRRIKIKKRKKKEKERPFDDADTVIQWREDFVQDYIKDPLYRKATETPIVERVVTEPMKKDMLTVDEDSDIGVRTREKQLPVMPLDDEFMRNMRESVPTTLLKDVQNNLRFYNDSIRNPSTRELSKVFLLGIVRQLRYWTLTQTPQPDVPEGETAVDWILGNLLGRIDQDMSLLAKHFCPEIDKIYFRRWRLELNILKHELEFRKSQTDDTRARIETDGFDPMDPDAAQTIELPQNDTLAWMKDNPKMVKVILNDPNQREQLLGNVWSEIFNNDGNIAYLNLMNELTLRAEMDPQQSEPLNILLSKLREGDLDALESMKTDGQFANYLSDIELIQHTLSNTHSLEVLQALLAQADENPTTVATESFEDLDTVHAVVEKPSINISY